VTTITASFDTLVAQGSMTASEFFRKAVQRIDDMFGEGYAKKNPQLVASFMQTAAIDLASTTVSKVLGEAIEELAGAVRSITP
jgi:hypothetical protein